MKQSEIWLINLDPTVGAEIKKTRPAVIVNDDTLGKLPLKIIVPITDWKERYAIAPWMICLEPDLQNGLNKISAADCFQVRPVSQKKFVKRVGVLSDSIMENIRTGLSKVLSIKVKRT
jgi:mRNA interferase MazF